MATIVTGQQIGIGGGPCYTVYKVLGAVKLAETIGGQAIYWLETNDADFEEINWLAGVDTRGEYFRLKWSKLTGGRRSGDLTVDNNLLELFNEYFDRIGNTAYTIKLRRWVLQCYPLKERLQVCSRRLAEKLFAPFKLEYFSPDDPTFRSFSHPYLMKEIAKSKEAEQINAFVLIGDVREALFKRSGNAVTRDGRIVKVETSILLPNVMTRSVIQDAFFNCHTYIAGPGEVAYIKKLSEQYQFHGVSPSTVQARMALTLLSQRDLDRITTLGLTVADFKTKSLATLQYDFLKRQSGVDLRDLAKRFKKEKTAFLSSLNSSLTSPFSFNIYRSLEKNLFKQLKHLKGAERKALKNKHKQELNEIRKLSQWIRPHGQAQERTLNVLQMINRWGFDLIKILAKSHAFEEKYLVLPD